MKITAIATEDLEKRGLTILPSKMELSVHGNYFPDTYGNVIGRYDKKTGKFESYFKKDSDGGNTKYFDEYREKGNLVEKHRNVIDRTNGFEEKQVIDYCVMYDIKESSKNRPTEIENYVDNSICMNGHHVCEYELLFTCGDATRRTVVTYSSNNIPMYEFISALEGQVEEALARECEEDNFFKDFFTFSESEDDDFNDEQIAQVTMFDALGMNYDIEIKHASDLMAMLVSVRLLSCKFVEDK